MSETGNRNSGSQHKATLRNGSKAPNTKLLCHANVKSPLRKCDRVKAPDKTRVTLPARNDDQQKGYMAEHTSET